MMQGRHIPIAVVGLSLNLFLFAALAEDLWIEAGPVYRGGMKTKSVGSSHVQNGNIHAAAAAHVFPGDLAEGGSAGPNPDDITQYGNRSFDDGYVNMDAGTGNPDSIDPNVTWFWGYEDGSQYDAGSDTLTYHRSSTESGTQVGQGAGQNVSLRTVRNSSANFDDTFNGWGTEIVAGYPLSTRDRLRIDLCGGFAGIWGADAGLGGSTFAEQVQDDRYLVTDTYDYRDSISDTYTYDTAGVTIPAAPHSGTYDGPFETPPVIPSPLIPNRPSSTSRETTRTGTIDRNTRLTSSTAWSAQNLINLDSQTDLYELWLGPRLGVATGERSWLHITPKVSMNYVDVGVNRSESFVATYANGNSATLNSWTDSGSESKLIMGAGVNIGADVEFGNGFFAGVWGGYEWVSDEVDVQVGPNRVSVDASGYIAGAVLGYRFGGESPRMGSLSEPPRDIPEEAAAEPVGELLPDAAPTGERLFKELVQLAEVSTNRAETVPRAVQTLAEERPQDFAALMAYIEENNLGRATPVAQAHAKSVVAVVAPERDMIARGQQVYDQLVELAADSKAPKEMIRYGIEAIRVSRPDDFAALMAYMKQRKSVRSEKDARPPEWEILSKGKRIYEDLTELAMDSKNPKELLWYGLRAMKVCRPDDFAALMAYVQQQKSGQAQMAMR